MKLFFVTFLFFAARTGTNQMATSLFVKTYHFSEHIVGRFTMFESTASLLFGFTAFKLIDIFNRKHIFTFSALHSPGRLLLSIESQRTLSVLIRR